MATAKTLLVLLAANLVACGVPEVPREDVTETASYREDSRRARSPATFDLPTDQAITVATPDRVDDPATDEEHAAAIRAAYLEMWAAHDEWTRKEEFVNHVSNRARETGLIVGHDEEKCGPNVSAPWGELWMPKADELMACLGIYRKARK
jgi:hypothetical protein